jgi:hypothetical protein
LALVDFHTAFFVVGTICALSTIMFLRLPKGAGQALTRGEHAH